MRAPLSFVVVLAAVACGGPREPSAGRDSAASPAAVAPAPREGAVTGATASATAASAATPAPPASDSTRAVGKLPSARPRTARPPAAPGPRRVMLGDLDLTGVGYDRGDPNAPVVLVDFSDFGCPYCASFSRETYPALEREYVATGKVFFKYVPFVMGTFPNGQQAARAAECAGEQGKFWAMHDRLYAGQGEWKRSLAPYRVFQQYAIAAGADSARFGVCYTGEPMHPRTRQATDAADRLGVRVTPSFVLGRRGIEGALPLAQFRELLDAALRGER